VRPLQAFTDAAQTARIVAEVATSGDLVCGVARRRGLWPRQLLFGWRHQLRESAADAVKSAPAVLDGGSSAVPEKAAEVQRHHVTQKLTRHPLSCENRLWLSHFAAIR
jgi:transposase-like protein